MTPKKFQKFTLESFLYPKANQRGIESVEYLALGLSGEAGEVANKVKKVIRDNNSVLDAEHKEKILKEISDVLWYTARLLIELDSTFEEAFDYNYRKAMDRLERGTLQGNGDNR